MSRRGAVDRTTGDDAASRTGGRAEESMPEEAMADERARHTADDLARRGRRVATIMVIIAAAAVIVMAMTRISRS